MTTDSVTEVIPASPTPRPRSLVSRPVQADRVFRAVCYAAGGITVAIMLAVGVFLSGRAGEALARSGPAFLWTQAWSPEGGDGQFGIAAVLFGTVTIAFIALSIALPLSLATALLISEVVPGRIRSTLISLVDLMAAVPSVVFGLWGVFFLQANVIPVSQWISTYFAWIPLFAVTDPSGARVTDAGAFTSSAFIAGIVVSLMIVPTQTSVMREAFSQAPLGEREGALALGSTRWGMIRTVVLPIGRGGITISPIFTINWQVLKTGPSSVSALIALRYGEASQVGLSALMAAGLVLFIITLIVNFTASTIVARSRSGAESN